ncbi:hypothetical protein GGF46_004778, partial [Coemansia sp. RSA 552]
AAAVFWEQFQEQSQQIRVAVSRGEDARTQLRALGSELREALIYLPPYDQKQLTTELDNLRQLQHQKGSAVSRKSGFRFKTSGIRKPASKEPQSSPAASIESKAVEDAELAAPRTNSLLFSDITSKWVVADQTLGPNQPNEPTECELRDIADSVIDLRPVSGLLRALNCHRLKNSVIIGGMFSGSATIRDASNCVVVLGVRQLRFEGCHGVDVFAYCTSHPIIEHSAGMRFALPPSVLTQDRVLAEMPNMYDQVSDFNWLKRQHSPNWSLLPAADSPDGLWALFQDTHTAHPLDMSRKYLPECK